MARILLVAGGVTLVVVLILVAAVQLLSSDDDAAAPRPEATVTVTATPEVVATVTVTATPEPVASGAVADAETGTPKATSDPAPEPGSSGAWRRVAMLSGSGDQQGPTFKVQGDRQKLTWMLDGSEPVALIDVVEGDVEWWESGGEPEASPATSGTGNRTLRLKRGEYYLSVFSGGCTWTIAVWDRR